MSKEAMKQWLKSLQWAMHIYQGVSPPHLIESVLSLEKAIAEAEKQEQDSTCNDTLRAQFKAYPRTCKKCGLGPCIGKPKQEQGEPLTFQDIAHLWMHTNDYYKFARAIEAAHGIKE